MKFLIDESSGRAIVDFLRQAGHDVVSVAEESLGLPDLAVISFAENSGRILVTNDKDFGDQYPDGASGGCIGLAYTRSPS
jgi:predicted nuclease of predicted toxin-antitoxin system